MKISLAVGIWATHMFQALAALPPTDAGPISVACFCPKPLSPCTTCTELLVDEQYTCKTECITKCFDLLNDPKNCGKCGNVCPSGYCANGGCSAPPCPGYDCGSPDWTCGDNCVCFRTASGSGFCGPGTSCAPLADCNTDADCALGTVCLTGTCCGRNVCLGPQGCENGHGLSLKRSLMGIMEKRRVGGIESRAEGPWTNRKQG